MSEFIIDFLFRAAPWAGRLVVAFDAVGLLACVVALFLLPFGSGNLWSVSALCLAGAELVRVGLAAYRIAERANTRRRILSLRARSLAGD